MEKFFFYLFALAAIGGALSTVTRKNPLASAISLVVTFVALAGLYLLNAAPFVGILQILVYAGAIMVLVVFVIMFLNLPEAELEEERVSKPGLILSLFLLAPLVALCVGVMATSTGEPAEITVAEGTETAEGGAQEAAFGSIKGVGDLMFDKYMFQFELVSVLLLVAIVGSILLAKKRL